MLPVVWERAVFTPAAGKSTGAAVRRSLISHFPSTVSRQPSTASPEPPAPGPDPPETGRPVMPGSHRRFPPPIRGKSTAASRRWSFMCEHFNDTRPKARQCVPNTSQISSRLNIWSELAANESARLAGRRSQCWSRIFNTECRCCCTYMA